MEHDQKVKTKMVQEQGLLVKMKFLLCYNVKIVMWWGNESIGGIRIWGWEIHPPIP